MKSLYSELVSLGHDLGKSEKDYVILGEGNISGKDNDRTFLVKASGASLSTLTEKDLVEVHFDKVLNLLGVHTITDEEIRVGLAQARVADDIQAIPSIETFLHAILLSLNNVNFIGHTHPTTVNSILCSQRSAEAFSGSLFPDQIVYCGPEAVFIPYTDPGLPLALCVKEKVEVYIEKWEAAPKVILLENHGFIALGNTPTEVKNISAMAKKAAKIIIGTYALGGPRFLTEQAVDRIYQRPDEKYRKTSWGMK